MRRVPRVLFGVTACAATTLLACARPAEVRYEREVAATPEAAEHAIHRERLDSLMRRLERLHNERLPQALDPSVERRQRIEAVAEIALAMADAAQRIPTAEATSLPNGSRPEDRATRAGTLRQLSLELAEGAETWPDERLRLQIRSIDQTCSGCHAVFRASDGRADD